MLEELPIDERIKQMIGTDVLFAVHGTGVANMLFMTRHSYFIEAYPPHWYWSCYQRFARAIGVKGVVFKSRGERGPECKDAEDKSAECQYKGIRDRNFNMSVNDGIKYLWEARLYVIENKYHRDPVTIEKAWIVCFENIINKFAANFKIVVVLWNRPKAVDSCVFGDERIHWKIAILLVN